jgi:F0F1-type ATP synthase membrane subunit a
MPKGFIEMFKRNKGLISKLGLVVIFFNFSRLVLWSIRPSLMLDLFFSFAFVLWRSQERLKIFKPLKIIKRGVIEGTSLLMVPIFSIFEIISRGVRPFSLSLRLVVNLNVGHFLIHSVSECNLFLFVLFVSVYELGVCLIQAFVFIGLLYQYYKEI